MGDWLREMDEEKRREAEARKPKPPAPPLKWWERGYREQQKQVTGFSCG